MDEAKLSLGNKENKMRGHLVFAEKERAENKGLITAISQYCIVTGWNHTLEEAAIWAQQGGGEDPDAILLNSTVFFSGIAKPNKQKTKEFLRLIMTIKQCRLKSRIILLLSENMLMDRELIVNLLKMQIYNLWFLDSFDENDVRNFMLTDRNMEDVEQYLECREKEWAYYRSLQDDSVTFTKNRAKIFKPYHVQSNIIAFWSENDHCLNYALGVLTGLNLARQGFKVALVETVSPVPCLASCLSLEHPYYNMSHALSMYVQGNNDFIRNCLYNAEKYRQDPYTVNREETEDLLHFFPDTLYFLPDGKREDNASQAVMQEQWKAFITQLARIIIFEKGFNFLVFVCTGRNSFNQVVLEELAYTRFITVDMLPANVLYGINEREKRKGRTFIVGSRQVSNINKEIKALGTDPFLYPPDCFINDFLQYVYTRDYRKITGETHTFVLTLMEAVGVKVAFPDIDKKSLTEWLRNCLK